MPSERQITTPVNDSLLRGFVELEHTEAGVVPHRLPGWARRQADDAQLTMVESQPSGVRLVFATEATSVEVRARATRVGFQGAPLRPAGSFDLTVDDQLLGRGSLETANLIMIDMSTGERQFMPAETDQVIFDDLPAGSKVITIWLPHNETVELVELRTDAPVTPHHDHRPVWVHHGSSISHGSNAVHATGTWPAVAALRSTVDLINLGFGGSAMLDQFTARTIRDLPADLISIKIGINLVNLDLFRLRAFAPAVHGFLDTIRDGHPETPMVIISPILCPVHEDTPGPGAFDQEALARGEMKFIATGDPATVTATPGGRLTLAVIREQLESIVTQRAEDDPNLTYLDGRDLYGARDAEELPLPDNLHPDAETHVRMGERFADLVLRQQFDRQ